MKILNAHDVELASNLNLLSAVPVLSTTMLGEAVNRSELRPLLVLGPSLGTSVVALWSEAAKSLAQRFDVIGFDLPGHGASLTAEPARSMATLAQAVLAAVDRVQRDRGQAGQAFYYAGVSVSGCIGLQLLLDAPQRIKSAAILNSAAKIGEAAGWHERAQTVRCDGPASLRASSAQRWFAPGFVERQPAQVDALLQSLCAAQGAGYAGVCEALADFDVRARLGAIAANVLVIGGQDDVATPPEQQQQLASGLGHASVTLLPSVGHLSPAEQPKAVAEMLSRFFDESSPAS